jgi:hypothetical protein
LNYKLNESWNLHLTDRIVFLGHWDLAGYSDVITPNMILLNFYYRIPNGKK